MLTNSKYWKRKTILTNRQVPKLTTLSVISQIYDIDFLRNWVNDFSEFRTSGDKGRGRSDIVDVSKFLYGSGHRESDMFLQDLRK